MEDLPTSLSPDSSLPVALVEHRWVEMIEAMVAGNLAFTVTTSDGAARPTHPLQAGWAVARRGSAWTPAEGS